MSEYRNSNSRPQTRNAAQRPAGQRGSGNRPPQNGRRPVKKKKKSNLPFILIIAVIAILAVVIGVIVGSRGKDDSAAPVTAVPQTQTEQNAGTAATDQTQSVDVSQLSAMLGQEDMDVQGLTKNEMVEVTDLCVTPGLNEDWMNVLLLGSDARSLTESSRSDTMIICSINTKTGEVKLSSLMRDTAINFDDLGTYNGTYRLNTANFFGGPNQVMRTLNRHLGMNIEYYAMVDFTSFSIIAEKLGGIELDISEAEMGQINKNAYDQLRFARDNGIDETELEATNVLLEQYGENVHLNGRQVLAYARIRKIDSDFSRAERQRKVLIAMMNKLMGKSAQDILGMAMSLAGYVKTNLSVDQIISVAATVLGSGLTDVDQLRLPVEGTYVQDTREGESMLYDTNWEMNKTTLMEFIYE